MVGLSFFLALSLYREGLTPLNSKKYVDVL